MLNVYSTIQKIKIKINNQNNFITISNLQLRNIILHQCHVLQKKKSFKHHLHLIKAQYKAFLFETNIAILILTRLIKKI